MATDRDTAREVTFDLAGTTANLRELLLGNPSNTKPITGDEVAFHDDPKIILPRDMTYGRAYKVLARLEEEAEKETQFTRFFRYRPDDGAYAAFQVVKDKWGMSLGKSIQSFFGSRPPEMRTINIGVGSTMQVPWGMIEIPTLPGLELYIGETQDRDYGRIFGIQGTGPRKYRDEIEDFFDQVQSYLETNSIYRGRAIVGSDDPEFLDLSSFDASKIVFAQSVEDTLEGTLWAPIRYSQSMRDNDVPLKRAVLAYGPYGTGKTSTGQLTAQVAVENGWTFISARPGRDKIEDVLRTARLYQPAVVFVEDIDTATSTGDADDVSKFLDAFDGITAKGGELMILMTTNHIEHIHKGMLRPGRLDSVVEIAGLDDSGIERLIKAVVPSAKLSDDVDYAEVARAMEGFLPAFVREAINRAITFSISRLKGESTYVIDTPDLVGAATSLHPQLAALNDAGTGKVRPTLDEALRETVKGAAKELGVHSVEYNTVGAIKDLNED